MEGKAGECSVAYLFGTPRFAILPVIHQLGLVDDAADQAWVDYAAGELTQAEGRLRLPRRTKPCSVMVEGNVAPMTWHTENIDRIIETVPLSLNASMREGALLWRTQREVAAILGETCDGSQPGHYVKDAEALRKLAYPGIAESCGLYARMGPARRKTHDDLFSWVPSEDD